MLKVKNFEELADKVIKSREGYSFYFCYESWFVTNDSIDNDSTDDYRISAYKINSDLFINYQDKYSHDEIREKIVTDDIYGSKFYISISDKLSIRKINLILKYVLLVDVEVLNK